MAYWSSKHESTGQTPNRMLYGEENILPLEAFTPDTPDKRELTVPEFSLNLHKQLKLSHEKAYESLQKAAEYQKRGYLPKLNTHQFRLKDPVWYWLPTCKGDQCPKLSSFWDGPFYVVKVYSDILFAIQKSENHKPRVVHHDQIKRCYLRVDADTSWIDNLTVTLQQQPTPVTLQNDKAESKSDIDSNSRPNRIRKPPVRLGDWFYDF